MLPMAVTITNAKSSLSLVLKVKSCPWDVEEFTNVSERYHLGHPNALQAGEGMGHLQISAPVHPPHPSDQNIAASSMSIHWQSLS